jgi:hypothetical protein
MDCEYHVFMIRIPTAEDLYEAFRPLDRDEVIMTGLKFPLGLTDYFTWVEPSGFRIYLLFEDPQTGKPKGIAFERTRGVGESVPRMCDWCHSVRGGNTVGLLSAIAAKNRKIGIELCSDLSCREKLRDTPGVSDLRETLTPEQKMRRLLGKMSSFAHHHLF